MSASYHASRLKKPSAGDCELLASLHLETLPDSVPALLGRSYAKRFYRFAGQSPLEHIAVVRDEGQRIIGAGLSSTSPGDLSVRLLKATLPGMIAGTLGALVAGPGYRRSALLRVLSSPPAPKGDCAAMTLLYLFTASGYRGRGVGRAVVEGMGHMAAESEKSSLTVLTEDDPGNRALGFYQRLAFARQDGLRHGSRDFVLLERPVSLPLPN